MAIFQSTHQIQKHFKYGGKKRKGISKFLNSKFSKQSATFSEFLTLTVFSHLKYKQHLDSVTGLHPTYLLQSLLWQSWGSKDPPEGAVVTGRPLLPAAKPALALLPGPGKNARDPSFLLWAQSKERCRKTKESCLGNEEGPRYLKPHCLDVKLSLLTTSM